eukprot:TRINITY_DN2028_c1_g1_i2.p1 TRINITY_DN2028_c1_g1~~TRINITY_DN2028_c1_g1_i2.p1  ORF type:complete len:367 (-),score=45.84 TRINITY_DN2028_c1_g1_i2:403-1455(-)
MSLKRAAEDQLRRSLPDSKKQVLDSQNNQLPPPEDDFIELQTFKYSSGQDLCQEGSNSGFLVTCKYKREKSCLRELLKILDIRKEQSRIVKLACNGVVLLLIVNITPESLFQKYQDILNKKGGYLYVQRATPILKITKESKENLVSAVSQATQEFFEFFPTTSLKDKHSLQQEEIGSRKLSGGQEQTRDEQAWNQPNLSQVGDQKQIQNEKSKNDKMDDNQQNMNEHKKLDNNILPTTPDNNNVSNQTEAKQKSLEGKIKYAVAARTRSSHEYDGSLTKKHLIELGAQGFVKGYDKDDAQVSLKSPQVVVVLEGIPLANELLVGVGLMLQEWCTTRPKLQPIQLMSGGLQ